MHGRIIEFAWRGRSLGHLFFFCGLQLADERGELPIRLGDSRPDKTTDHQKMRSGGPALVLVRFGIHLRHSDGIIGIEGEHQGLH